MVVVFLYIITMCQVVVGAGAGGGGGGVCVCVVVCAVGGWWVGVSVAREQLRKEKIARAMNKKKGR